MDTKIEKYLVGGAVRDQLLGLPVSERDWVVVGATPEQMLAQGFRPVGQDFPVFLDPATGEEHALARTERKSGRGYGGFVFHASPYITLEEDLQRRDLTVNAMAQAADGRLIDPYGGQRDLQARILRHVSPAFAEDPLRVLRVARFAARYANLGFIIAPETLDLMRGLAESGELQALTAERSWKEISRALLEARPEVFFEVLLDCHALNELFPELQELFDLPGPCPRFANAGRFQLALLQLAARQQLPLPARWAGLVLGLAKFQTQADAGLAQVQALNRRYRIPRDCGELAQLCCTHIDRYRQAPGLAPSELMDLFRAMDIYRRPERFELFLAVGEVEQQALGQPAGFAHSDFLRDAADAARGVSVQLLLEKGLTGSELGVALEQTRLHALEEYRKAAKRG